MKLTSLCFLLLFLSAPVLAADHHQVGAAGSGFGSSGKHHLQSVVGQNMSGRSGPLVTGFLSTITRYGFVAGDVNSSGDIDISDVVFLISYIFGTGPAPIPLERGDVDCNKGVDISDAVFLVAYIFAGGSAPRPCW
jgi:hypothetical protein